MDHCRSTGRIGVVNQHRGVEIAIREHAHNMAQMHPDLLDAGFVVWVVCSYDDFAAVPENGNDA